MHYNRMNGRLLQKWMLDNKVTCGELANRLGVNASTLWRNMYRKTDRQFILALACVTELPIGELEVRTKPNREKMLRERRTGRKQTVAV